MSNKIKKFLQTNIFLKYLLLVISICVTSQVQQLKTNKNREFHHSSKTDNPEYPIY